MKIFRAASLIAASTWLFGCAQIPPTISSPSSGSRPSIEGLYDPLGLKTIVPAEFARIGRIYVKGHGKRPQIVTTSGEIYSEVCWADVDTRTAQTIIESGKELQPRGQMGETNYKVILEGKGSAGQIGWLTLIGSLDASGRKEIDAGFKSSEIKRLSKEAQDSLIAILGPDCRKKIRQAGGAYLVTHAAEAKDLVIIGKYKYGVGAQTSSNSRILGSVADVQLLPSASGSVDQEIKVTFKDGLIAMEEPLRSFK